MQKFLRSLSLLSLTYYAAITLMVLETAYIALTVVKAPDQGDTLSTALDYVRAGAVPLIIELFSLGLVQKALQLGGRLRWGLLGLAVVVLCGAAVTQAAAMSAHPVDPDTVARMGAGMYWVTRYVIAVAGPVAVAAIATIKVVLNETEAARAREWAELSARAAATAKALQDADTKIRELLEGNASLQQSLHAAAEEIRGLRAEQRAAATLAAQTPVTPRLARPVAEQGQVSATPGAGAAQSGRVDRVRLAEELAAQPGITADQLAALFGVSAAAIRKTEEWRQRVTP